MSGDIEAEHEALLQFLYLCPIGVIQIDAHGTIELANPEASRLIVPTLKDGRLENLFDALSFAAPELRSISSASTISRGVICRGVEIDLGHDKRDGTRKDCWANLSLLRLAENKQMAVLHDITDLVHEREAHQWKAAYLNTIFQNVRDYAIFSLDRDGMVSGWNESVGHLLGIGPEETPGRHFESFWHEEPGQTMGARTLLEIARQSGAVFASGWQQRPDDSQYWADCIISRLDGRDAQHQSYAVIMRDMTEQKISQERLLQLATTDFLTGLHNRRSFLDRAEALVKEASSQSEPVSILVLDVDDLRKINQTFGEKQGDEALKAVAQIVLRHTHEDTASARVSGEEFALILKGQQAAETKALAERIRESVENAAFVTPLTVSIGIAHVQSGGATADLLLDRASQAMRDGKADGYNRITPFSAGFEPAVAASRA